MVYQLNQYELENSTQKQGKCLHQFQDITSDCHKDHIQFITQAAVQLIAIYPVFTFTMFDHWFNDWPLLPSPAKKIRYSLSKSIHDSNIVFVFIIMAAIIRLQIAISVQIQGFWTLVAMAAFRVCQSIVKLPRICFHAHNQPRLDRSYQSHFGIQPYVNFYKFRWIHSALQYRTPDEVHFGTCKQQAMGDSNSKDFTPIFPWKAVQHRGRCAHRLGCAKTCQQPSSKLCQSIAPASFVIAWRRRQYHATEVWINCFEPWSYQYFAKFLSFQINFLAITPSSNQIILFIINKLNLFFTIKKIMCICFR